MSMDGSPLKPESQVAKLALFDSKSWPGQIINQWGYNITSIDGSAIPHGATFVQLAPGQHNIEYKCFEKFSLYDAGGAHSTRTATFNLEPGKIYFGWVTGGITGYLSQGTYTKTTGWCQLSSLSNKNPFMDVY